MSFVKVTRSKRNKQARLKSSGGINKIQNHYNDISNIYFDLLDRCNEQAVMLLDQCEPSDFFKLIERHTPKKTPKKTPQKTPQKTPKNTFIKSTQNSPHMRDSSSSKNINETTKNKNNEENDNIEENNEENDNIEENETIEENDNIIY